MDHWAPVVRYGADGVSQFTSDASSFQTVSGRFRPTATATDTAAHSSAADTWSDAYGEITVPLGGGLSTVKWGIWLRVVDANNHYRVYGDGSGGYVVLKMVSGTPTTIQSSPSFTVGATGPSGTPGTFRAEIQGDIIRAFWRGKLIGSLTGETSITTPGFVSMFMRCPSAVGDSEISRFEAGPLTANYTADVEVQQAGPTTRSRRLG